MHHGQCIVDNVGQGFDVYKLESGELLKSLVTRDPIKTYPKSVTFADGGQIVVSGSDHNLVYIFERKTGKLVETLKHNSLNGVQIIAVSDIPLNML